MLQKKRFKPGFILNKETDRSVPCPQFPMRFDNSSMKCVENGPSNIGRAKGAFSGEHGSKSNQKRKCIVSSVAQMKPVDCLVVHALFADWLARKPKGRKGQ